MDQIETELDLISLSNNFYTSLEKKGRSFNTLKNYRTDLNCFFSYLESSNKSFKHQNINGQIINLYGDFLLDKYSSTNSRRRRVQALRIFFDYLVELNLFQSNPVRKIPTSPKFVDRPKPTSMTSIKTLLSYLTQEIKHSPNNEIIELIHYRNLVTTLLIYSSGLKVSDLKNLKVDQFFLENDPRVLIKHPKRDPYTIPLSSDYLYVHEKYIKKLSKMKKKSKKEFPELLFNANQYGILKGGLSPRGLEIIFLELAKKLIIDLTPKSLRQACIFKWLREGHNDQTIKDWLGMAPSYDLGRYKKCLDENIYLDDFVKKALRKF